MWTRFSFVDIRLLIIVAYVPTEQEKNRDKGGVSRAV